MCPYDTVGLSGLHGEGGDRLLPGFQHDILLAECLGFWQYVRHLGTSGEHYYYTDSKLLVTM